VDTYAYFGEPVYIYSLKEGINDGFLTPFKVVQLATTIDDYVYTPDDTVVEGEVEEGHRMSRKISTASSRSKSVRRTASTSLMSRIDQREKTLVFCSTSLMPHSSAT
jgi:type I restriction enzyme R subunit